MVTHLPQDPEDLPVTVTAVVACAAHEASKPRLLLDGTKVVVYYHGTYYKSCSRGGRGHSALLELLRRLNLLGLTLSTNCSTPVLSSVYHYNVQHNVQLHYT